MPVSTDLCLKVLSERKDQKIFILLNRYDYPLCKVSNEYLVNLQNKVVQDTFCRCLGE